MGKIGAKHQSAQVDVKTFRELHRLTQVQLAKLLNTSRRTVQGWESGSPHPGCLVLALMWVEEHHGVLDKLRIDQPKKKPKKEEFPPKPNQLWAPKGTIHG